MKQERYLNDDGTDWIDECAATLTPEEFRGAMKFTIGKYKKRMNKKDPVEMEQAKIVDYENRWDQYERQRILNKMEYSKKLSDIKTP
jgi:murein L,D-transpeptidase YafK